VGSVLALAQLVIVRFNPPATSPARFSRRKRWVVPKDEVEELRHVCATSVLAEDLLRGRHAVEQTDTRGGVQLALIDTHSVTFSPTSALSPSPLNPPPLPSPLLLPSFKKVRQLFVADVWDQRISNWKLDMETPKAVSHLHDISMRGRRASPKSS
jgi:hypothetical protein